MFAALSLPTTGLCEVESVNEVTHCFWHFSLFGSDLGGFVVVAGWYDRLQTINF
jgi:hypothetical protein